MIHACSLPIFAHYRALCMLELHTPAAGFPANFAAINAIFGLFTPTPSLTRKVSPLSRRSPRAMINSRHCHDHP